MLNVYLKSGYLNLFNQIGKFHVKDKDEEVNIAKDQANNDSEGSPGSPKRGRLDQGKEGRFERKVTLTN